MLALQKKESESPVPFKYIPEDSILQLTSAFKSFNETPAFRSALHVIILAVLYLVLVISFILYTFFIY